MAFDPVMFRMVERLVLSGTILVVSLIVMAGFWRTLQEIDFKASRESISAGGSAVLATPVFVLLAMVGYAWVSLSNPIALPGGGAPAPPAPTPTEVSLVEGTATFMGSTAAHDPEKETEANAVALDLYEAAGLPPMGVALYLSSTHWLDPVGSAALDSTHPVSARRLGQIAARLEASPSAFARNAPELGLGGVMAIAADFRRMSETASTESLADLPREEGLPTHYPVSSFETACPP